MASYAIAATVNDPVTAIGDMSLAIERVIVTMDNANSELMEHVVGRLNDPASPMHHAAFGAWCTHQVASEKLVEIRTVLDEVEGKLLTPPDKSQAQEAEQAEWHRAHAAWAEAHETVRRYNATPGGVPADVMDAAVRVERETVYHLAAAPAPNRAAVGIKINALLDYLENCAIDEAALRTIAADALRAEG
ncbi:hypothetical protein ACWGNZ_07945 [Sphingomonas zeae]|jgi:hypothetical protein